MYPGVPRSVGMTPTRTSDDAGARSIALTAAPTEPRTASASRHRVESRRSRAARSTLPGRARWSRRSIATTSNGGDVGHGRVMTIGERRHPTSGGATTRPAIVIVGRRHRGVRRGPRRQRRRSSRDRDHDRREARGQRHQDPPRTKTHPCDGFMTLRHSLRRARRGAAAFCRGDICSTTGAGSRRGPSRNRRHLPFDPSAPVPHPAKAGLFRTLSARRRRSGRR